MRRTKLNRVAVAVGATIVIVIALLALLRVRSADASATMGASAEQGSVDGPFAPVRE